MLITAGLFPLYLAHISGNLQLEMLPNQRCEAFVAVCKARNVPYQMTFRNTHPAFDGPLQMMEDEPEGKLTMTRQHGRYIAILAADLKTHSWTIHYADEMI